MNGRTNVTTGTNTDILEVPLDPVTNFVAEEGTGKVLLSWTDPKDKYATPEGEMAQDPQQLVSVWSHTLIVRKEGSDPVDENDGVVIVSSSVRNQYESTQYTDVNVSNGIEYYYGAFAINEDGIASDGVYSSATPRVYDTVLANNTWDQIDEACSLGIAESFWEVGDEHPIEIPVDDSPTSFTAIIYGFNHDPLSDGSGTAVITFGIKETFYKCPYTTTYDSPHYAASNVRSILQSTYASMNSQFTSLLKEIRKRPYYGYWLALDTELRGSTEYTDKLFSLGFVEVNGDTSIFDGTYNGNETVYPYFSTQSNRQKDNAYWLSWGWASSSGSRARGGYFVDTNGSISYQGFSSQLDVRDQDNWRYISPAFCIGKSTV